MKLQRKKLIICLLIPLGVGGISAFLTRNSIQTFETLSTPPLSPPGWLFPVVWTILYLLMGFASYLILTSDEPENSGLLTYGLQLVFNFFWPIFFFNQQRYLFSFLWLAVLWLLILITTVQFCRNTKLAGYLFISYLLWVTFAGYLNFGIYLLNKTAIN